MQNISDMSVFIAVIEHLSMTKAGDSLGISPAVVSKRIKNLETRLGIRLLNRSTRRMIPTEEGLIYYDRCKYIIEEIENTELALSGMKVEASGSLKVSVPASFGRKHIAPVLATFMKRYPQINLQIQLTDKNVDLFDEGVDMVIRIGHIKESNLVARKLSPNQRILCASPEYLKVHGTPSHPDDLSHHSCLILGPIGVTQQTWQLHRKARIFKAKVGGRLVTNNGEVLRDAVLGGLGIAQKSTWDIGQDLKQGTIVHVLEDYSLESTQIFALYPHRLHLSPKVRVWLDFLFDQFNPTPSWE